MTLTACSQTTESNGSGSTVQNDLSSNDAHFGYNEQSPGQFELAQVKQGSITQNPPYELAPQENVTNAVRNGRNGGTIGSNFDNSSINCDDNGNVNQHDFGYAPQTSAVEDMKKQESHSVVTQKPLRSHLTKARAHTIATCVDAGSKAAGFDKMTFELLNKTLRDSDGRPTGAS